MSKSRKYLAVFMAVVMAAVFALSVFFVISESEHNCSGDDCQICQAVNLCLKAFDNTTPKPAASALSAVMCFALVLVIGAVSVCLTDKNLITLKVKLSN